MRSQLLVECTLCNGIGESYDDICKGCHGKGVQFRNETQEISELRKTGDNDNGPLPNFAWPGGYPLAYLDAENNILCPDCANENDPYSVMLVEYDINWDDDGLYCDRCGKQIESAYGENTED
jgi:hypothetical protein